MSRVVIMAGGTGGHVFPALAVAHELRRAGVALSWLGTRRGIESTLVPKQRIELDFISVQGVRGRGILGLLKAPFLVGLAVLQAISVLRTRKPDVVVGFGGFASGPGGIAAKLLGIPLLVHEQNAVAGTTNKLLSRVAAQVLTGFGGVFVHGEWVGNPVRSEIAGLPEPARRYSAREAEPLRLLVLGGSLGATAINELLPQALALLGDDERPQVWHQCGPKHGEATTAAYVKAQIQASVAPFIDDMAAAYEWADFVICRAGALTVAELSAAGVASLLVPLPTAIDDHQTHNAAVLAGVGAALSVPQKDLSPEKMADMLRVLCSDRQKLLKMAECARTVDRPNAAQCVAQKIEDLAHG